MRVILSIASGIRAAVTADFNVKPSFGHWHIALYGVGRYHKTNTVRIDTGFPRVQQSNSSAIVFVTGAALVTTSLVLQFLKFLVPSECA
jgi:hypothetical protein